MKNMKIDKKSDNKDLWNTSIQLMLGYLCVAKEAEASLTRRVKILDKFSLSNKNIATICGCNEQSVHNARNIYKRKGNGKKK